MDLVILESASKSKVFARHIEALGLKSDFKVAFCGGRIFDWSVGQSNSEWSPVNPEINQYLQSIIAQSETIVAMTDKDEQGEFIAYQIANLAKGKLVLKGDLSEISPSGVKQALSSVRAIDMAVVSKVLIERQMNLFIAEYALKRGFRPTSLQAMNVAQHLAHGFSVNKVGELFEINGERLFVDGLTLEKSFIDDARINGVLPPNTLDVLMDVQMKHNTSVKDVTKELNQCFEMGVLPYTRTPASSWHQDAIGRVEQLLDENAIYHTDDVFSSRVDSNVAHSSLYIADTDYFHSNLDTLMSVKERCLAVFSDRYHVGLQSSLLPNVAFLARKCAGRETPYVESASPELKVLSILTKTGFSKPSTLSGITTQLAKTFWANDGKINDQVVNESVRFSEMYFPNLSNSSDELNQEIKTFDVTAHEATIKTTQSMALSKLESISPGFEL